MTGTFFELDVFRLDAASIKSAPIKRLAIGQILPCSGETRRQQQGSSAAAILKLKEEVSCDFHMNLTQDHFDIEATSASNNTQRRAVVSHTYLEKNQEKKWTFQIFRRISTISTPTSRN